jgi:endonuclease-3
LNRLPVGRVISAIRRRVGPLDLGPQNAFHTLVATLISLRTKDEVTHAAAARLLARADTPAKLSRLQARTIDRLIYPAGFHKKKARTLRRIAKLLLDEHGGEVPDRLPALLALPGVGLKTANLVLSRGHGIPAICVDTHVHRIFNRLGYVETEEPDETEAALRSKLPRRYWIEVNLLLVRFGQKVCTPLSPRCSECPVARYCERVGVTRSR